MARFLAAIPLRLGARCTHQRLDFSEPKSARVRVAGWEKR